MLQQESDNRCVSDGRGESQGSKRTRKALVWVGTGGKEMPHLNHIAVLDCFEQRPVHQNRFDGTLSNAHGPSAFHHATTSRCLPPREAN
jgi:hypothetical protein